MPSSKSSARARSSNPSPSEQADSSKPPRSERAKPERVGVFLALAQRVVELAHADKSSFASARLELARLIEALEPTSRRKLIALMSAGKDARAIAGGLITPGSDAAPALFSGSSVRDLQRGLGIARATDFDVERPLEDWARAPAKSGIEERVWLRFGKELARSTLGEWTCLVAVSPGDALDKVYLRRRDGAWWSFGAALERPSPAEIARLSGRQPKGRRKLSVLPLGAIIPARCRADRSALRRAAAALSARFGCAGKASAV